MLRVGSALQPPAPGVSGVGRVKAQGSWAGRALGENLRPGRDGPALPGPTCPGPRARLRPWSGGEGRGRGRRAGGGAGGGRAASPKAEAGRAGPGRRGGRTRPLPALFARPPVRSHSVAPRGRHGSGARPPGAHTCLSGAGTPAAAGSSARVSAGAARAPFRTRGGVAREERDNGPVRTGWGGCGAHGGLGPGRPRGWGAGGLGPAAGSGAAGHLDSRTVTREAGGEGRFGRHCCLGCLVGVGVERAGSGQALPRVATPRLLHTPQPPLLVRLEFCVYMFHQDLNIKV